MGSGRTVAQAVAAGDAALVARLASRPIKPLCNNFVERPWGGLRMRAYKGLCALPGQLELTGVGLGEAFEIAADDTDDEARAHPSRLRFDDGSQITLPELLRRHGAAILGPELAARYDGRFPLLPKTLDVKELLSVQGHPEGHTEAYLIIDADPQATIRLGFNADVDPEALTRHLTAGRSRQQRLLDLLGADIDAAALQRLLQPWLADRDAGPAALTPDLAQVCAGVRGPAAAALLGRLKEDYWRMLDAMNALPVAAGQVIYNATPARIAAGSGRSPSAEVHALGNPQQREVLMLEIRRPGPTFRAWDNVRFPLRHVDIEAAIGALNLRRTEPAEYYVETTPVPGREGVWRSIRCADFGLEHLRPAAGTPVAIPEEPPHCLHAIRGQVELHSAAGAALGTLKRGESAIVPARMGAYHVVAGAEAAEIVKVRLPAPPA